MGMCSSRARREGRVTVRNTALGFPNLVSYSIFVKRKLVRVIAKRTLREFWDLHPDSVQQLKSWYQDASKAEWDSPSDIKRKFASASILKNSRVVFNISGNKYRLIVEINFPRKWVFIRFVGSHKEYDKIDANTI